VGASVCARGATSALGVVTVVAGGGRTGRDGAVGLLGRAAVRAWGATSRFGGVTVGSGTA
jgi:hypothetical protein